MKNKILNNEIYTKEEMEMFEQIEAGNYTSLKESNHIEFEKENNKAQAVAQNTIKKMTRKKSINLRLFESDINNIKVIALEKWLPYQTLLSSAIHQIATKQIELV